MLGRSKAGTLRLADEQRGAALRGRPTRFAARRELRAAVGRGGIGGAGFRFVVGEEGWDGELRTVTSVKELHDVTVATYPAASDELRTSEDGEGARTLGGARA